MAQKMTQKLDVCTQKNAQLTCSTKKHSLDLLTCGQTMLFVEVWVFIGCRVSDEVCSKAKKKISSKTTVAGKCSVSLPFCKTYQHNVENIHLHCETHKLMLKFGKWSHEKN